MQWWQICPSQRLITWCDCVKDLIQRMLVVDPMKRITIFEICMHPWFQPHLPHYLEVPPLDSMQQTKKGTVAYYLLLDNKFRKLSGYLGAEFKKPNGR
ncbi:SNF1-related protein kinase catalytic subunit alpha KIN10 [Artemisia annua]|uniref:SNF1-related protein kinase catalytic subunit alpha KIN10 n=1 Tax=Artemisia annua TaxID=35608 RepID=A0A2U1N375_ARTAN|nr:SNF1-related protein kinase catalytic subunit alpha KIN10 [Artemisia annua]